MIGVILKILGFTLLSLFFLAIPSVVIYYWFVGVLAGLSFYGVDFIIGIIIVIGSLIVVPHWSSLAYSIFGAWFVSTTLNWPIFGIFVVFGTPIFGILFLLSTIFWLAFNSALVRRVKHDLNKDL